MSDIFGMPDGDIVITHDQSKCAGRPCCVHNPSQHALSNAPLHWRQDRRLMERICPHGVGHPDLDHLAFVDDEYGYAAMHVQSVHGCDGCCREDAA